MKGEIHSRKCQGGPASGGKVKAKHTADDKSFVQIENNVEKLTNMFGVARSKKHII